MKERNVLICPLDWGLGHAARCIPVIRLLQQQGCKVYIAADARPMKLLQEEFPSLTFIVLPSYGITYPKGSNMILKMLRSIPRILRGIHREHEALEQIIKSYCIDLVISDNRWGLWSEKAYSVFITHQVTIKTPMWLRPFESLLYSINKYYMQRFNECWIPDLLGVPNLSGDLSHQRALPERTFFIGPLSRFYGMNVTNQIEPFNLLVIISGPEPQRSIFEELIIKQLMHTDLKAVIVKGITESHYEHQLTNNIRVMNFATAEQLFNLIHAAEMVVSRPGYSSIMDMAALGKNAIFVPTPGQTEQEYLAQYLTEQGIFYSMLQHDFNLSKALFDCKSYNIEAMSHTQNVLEMHINSIFQAMDFEK